MDSGQAARAVLHGRRDGDALTPPEGGDGAARFAARFPIVWHVIEAEGLPGLAAHGLLPASGLRRLAGAADSSANRDDYEPLALPGGGTAVLRLQIMPDAKLRPSLAGAYAGQPGMWRAHINSHVFFWADPARRDGFLRATLRERARSRTAPSAAPPVVLAFDTQALLAPPGPDAFTTTFNTGSTVRGAARARRDEGTFRPVAAYRTGPVAELALRGAVAPAVLARARLP